MPRKRRRTVEITLDTVYEWLESQVAQGFYKSVDDAANVLLFQSYAQQQQHPPILYQNSIQSGYKKEQESTETEHKRTLRDVKEPESTVTTPQPKPTSGALSKLRAALEDT